MSFGHKGLKQFFETGNDAGIDSKHAKRIAFVLALLNTAGSVQDMNLPGLKLHQLKGKRKDTWAVSVSGNWRMTFKFEHENVYAVDYEDYH